MNGGNKCGLTLIAALLLVLTACSTLPMRTDPPRVTLIGLSLVSVELFEQRYQVRLRMKNPNAFALPVRGLDFHLELNGKTFADGVSNQSLDVPAYGESVLALEVTSGLLQVFRQLQALEDSAMSGVAYRIQGNIAIGDFGRRLPFDYTGQIGLPDDPVPPATDRI
ncbi:MAG: LEA type 2 family protein [Thiogranum sp.]|nr:LEA type 2 family protein [Thiogranum sp.]